MSKGNFIDNIKAEDVKRIGELEDEIHEYQKEHSDGLTKHDINKTRMAIKLMYNADLDINPQNGDPKVD